LNRGKRFCRPLRNHSATWPHKFAYINILNILGNAVLFSRRVIPKAFPRTIAKLSALCSSHALTMTCARRFQVAAKARAMVRLGRNQRTQPSWASDRGAERARPCPSVSSASSALSCRHDDKHRARKVDGRSAVSRISRTILAICVTAQGSRRRLSGIDPRWLGDHGSPRGTFASTISASGCSRPPSSGSTEGAAPRRLSCGVRP
jgi:hypothetical protein